MEQAASASDQPAHPVVGEPSAGQLFEALIERIADRVVEKLEEQRKIDLVAGAVIQRIRFGAHYQEATKEPHRDSGT